jgi:DNA-directed RNA polymerase subunit RPC12/RpoP
MIYKGVRYEDIQGTDGYNCEGCHFSSMGCWKLGIRCNLHGSRVWVKSSDQSDIGEDGAEERDAEQ